MSAEYYEILGVSGDADQIAIKKAYRKLVAKYHPDRNKEAGADEKFKKIREAYDVLSDDHKRKAYDQFGKAGVDGFAGGGFGGGGGAGGEQVVDMGDLNDILNQFMGGNMGGVGDIFGGFRQGGAGVRPQRGEDLELRLEFTLEKANKGVKKHSIEYKHTVACKSCQSTGGKDGKVTKCSTCKGAGIVNRTKQSFVGTISYASPCPDCQGKGKTFTDACPDCQGVGVAKKEEKMEIKIPAGSYNGLVLKFTGGGNTGRNGGSAGDLYIRIIVKNHEEINRRGDNFYMDVKVPLHIAVLGGKIDINTLYEEVTMKIPAGTQVGDIFRINDYGPYKLDSSKKGDLYVKVDLKVPTKLSKAVKQAWQKVAEAS